MKKGHTAPVGCRAPYRHILVTLAWLAIAVLPLRAATLHVGQEKGAEFTTIQAAVDRAVSGDSIVIGPGSYRGRGNVDIDLQGKALTIAGTNPLDPNVVEATVIDCAGTQSEPHRGFYLADCNSVAISGLTITHGRASAGGAIFCQKSALHLAHCRIVENAAAGGNSAGGDPNGGSGGGLYGEDSFIRVTGCLVAGNTAGDGATSKAGPGGAGGNGGGICGVNSEVFVEASTIRDNAAGAGGAGGGAGGDGGGIYGEAVTLVDSTVWRNAAGDGGPARQSGNGGRGGGLFAQIATVERCVIEANRAGAGGIVNVPAPSDAKTEPVSGGPGGDGGGLYSDSLELTSSLVAGNRAGRAHAAGPRGLFENGDGGGIWCTTGAIRHGTIAGNVVFWRDTTTTLGGLWTSARGAAIFSIMPVPIENSIVYDNTPVQTLSPEGGSILYSDLMSGMAPKGGTNLFVEPLFVESGRWVDIRDANAVAEPDDPNAMWMSGDYHLMASSSCIDAGDPNYVPEPNETDLDGRPRRADAAVDMGAYEFQSLVPVYRFWSTQTSKHFYTLNEVEKTKLIADYGYVWSFEGIAYYAYARASEPNLMPVYRFWSATLGSHFYTISETERDKLIREFSGIWTFEGPVFYAWPEGRQPAGTQPVYRFWSDQLGSHFYTANEEEKDWVIQAYAKAWTFEGIVWYAYTEPPVAKPDEEKPPEEKPPVEPPVTPDPVAFEFAGGRDCASFVFQLKAYRDGQALKIDSPDVVLVPDSGRMSMIMDLASMTATLNTCHLESALLEHVATVSDSNSGEKIPFTLQVYGSFDAATTRGPYAIDAQSLSFPVAAGNEPGDANETFAVNGVVTLDGRKLDVRWTAAATRFDTAGRAVLDASALPNRLDVLMGDVFQWSRPEKEDLLLETTVKGHAFQLFVTSAQVQTTGPWSGKRAVPMRK